MRDLTPQTPRPTCAQGWRTPSVPTTPPSTRWSPRTPHRHGDRGASRQGRELGRHRRRHDRGRRGLAAGGARGSPGVDRSPARDRRASDALGPCRLPARRNQRRDVLDPARNRWTRSRRRCSERPDRRTRHSPAASLSGSRCHDEPPRRDPRTARRASAAARRAIARPRSAGGSAPNGLGRLGRHRRAGNLGPRRDLRAVRPGGPERASVGLATPSIVSLYDAEPRVARSLVVGVSQSGASPDIVGIVAAARGQGAPTLAITNDPASALAREAEHVLDLAAGPELAIAATKTYTTSLLAIARLSLALDPDPGAVEALAALPAAVERPSPSSRRLDGSRRPSPPRAAASIAASSSGEASSTPRRASGR